MVAKRKAQAEQVENLSDANIEKVIYLLEPLVGVKPITKKDACAFLGIAYNTARLDSIIKEYREKKQYEEERIAANKYKPATDFEIKTVLQDYCVNSDSIPTIAKRLFRNPSFVRTILEDKGVTLRPAAHDYFKPAIVSESSSRERFKIGETVYCTRYNINAIVKGEQHTQKYGFVYSLWLLGDWQQYAYVAAYDLASLEYLKEYGVEL